MDIPFRRPISDYRISRDEFELARKIVKDMEALVGTDGWVRLNKIAANQRAIRETEILAPSTAESDALHKEHLRGERFGITLILQTPLVIIEEAKQILELYRKQEKLYASSSDTGKPTVGTDSNSAKFGTSGATEFRRAP